MEIFKSRRFWSAITGLVVMVGAAFFPQLAEHINLLVPAIVGIVVVLIGGYAAEDVAVARNPVVNAINGPAYEVSVEVDSKEAQG